MPSAADIDAWIRGCSAKSSSRRELLALLDRVQTLHRNWKRESRSGIATLQTTSGQLVQESRLIRRFQTVLLPGELQTADYAKRVLTEFADLQGVEVRDVDAAVAMRMQRQRHLYDTNKRFEFIMAEPVLRWALCEPDVMRGQLDRLQTAIGLPNVRLGILPLDIPIHVPPVNSFGIFDDVVLVETFVGESAHRGEEAAAYSRVMDRLWDDAVTGEQARKLILSAAEKLRDEP